MSDDEVIIERKSERGKNLNAQKKQLLEDKKDFKKAEEKYIQSKQRCNEVEEEFAKKNEVDLECDSTKSKNDQNSVLSIKNDYGIIPPREAISSMCDMQKDLLNIIKGLEKDRAKLQKKYKTSKNKCAFLEKKVNSVKDSNEEYKQENKPKKSKSGCFKQSSQYDLIAKINTLIGVTEGWNVEFKDKDQIEKLSKNLSIAVGVIGRKNVGKTFLINKICGENFASSYYTSTDGICLKYCDENGKQLKVILDSPGMGCPVFYYNYWEIEQHIMNKSPTNISIQEYEKIKKLMILDKCMTEYFIQNFIAYSCNIILIIVEQLTEYDQKMIERIRYLSSDKKNILVIHNLFNLDLKEQVEEYAEFEIEGAFHGVKQNITNSDVFFYIQKPDGQKFQKNIMHIIFGKEGSESGDYFNEASLSFLKKFIEAEVETSDFNLLDKLNTYLKEKHQIYFNNLSKDVPRLELAEKPSERESKKKNGDKTWLFKLVIKQELELNDPELCALGLKKELILNYHMYVNQGKIREKFYYIEVPGCEEIPILTLKKLPKENEQVLTLNIKLKPKMLENFKPQIGGFDTNVMVRKMKINDEFGEYKCDKHFTSLENGILMLKFILKDDEDL